MLALVVLTQTLRAWDRDGLVSRRIYAEVPSKVEYSLTDLGASLLDPLEAVRKWAELMLRPSSRRATLRRRRSRIGLKSARLASR